MIAGFPRFPVWCCTVQFIREREPETPKMAEPYFQFQIWWQILNLEARIPIQVS